MDNVSKEPKKQSEPEIESPRDEFFSGRYFYAVGRRKTAIATARLYQDNKGVIRVNNKDISAYFPTEELRQRVMSPLGVAGLLKDFGVSIHVQGGGMTGHADSSALAIARALLKYNADLRPALKPHGLLRRDPRQKERKKPGLKRARRAPQWAKR